MSLSQGIKNTIINNRGKLGALAGIGLGASIVAAPKVYSDNEVAINQAGYNAMVKGNNLIAPVTGAPVISPEVSDLVNKYYTKVKEEPTNFFGAENYIPTPNEAFKVSKFMQGVSDKITGNEVTESAYSQGPLLVPIKQLILEGYTYNEIQESIANKMLLAGAMTAGSIWNS